MRTMPPEAFTHKELAQAMNWRESQPEYVKVMTTTPESLISLYKKAQRTNPGAGNGSRMSESFRSDLKHLAEGLKDFDPDASAGPAMPQPSPQEPVHQPPAETQFQENSFGNFQKPANPVFSPTPQPQPQRPPQMSQPQTSQVTGGLDVATQQMIREVKNGLNLSSETEAVRMLIKLGFERAKAVLPPSLNI